MDSTSSLPSSIRPQPVNVLAVSGDVLHHESSRLWDLLDEVEDALEEITDEYMEAVNEFRVLLRSAKTDEERRALVAASAPQPGPYADRALALAKKHPGTNGAWQALSWIVGRAGGTPAAAEAYSVLTTDYIGDERLGDIGLRASRMPHSESLWNSLERVVKQSPHHDVRGRAAFSLAMLYKKQVEDGDGKLEEFKRLMKVVVDDYGDVPYYRGVLKDKAGGELFELERLQIGMIAPDIEGEDLDGVAFKLSDYRGKVVVLDFWGNW